MVAPSPITSSFNPPRDHAHPIVAVPQGDCREKSQIEKPSCAPEIEGLRHIGDLAKDVLRRYGLKSTNSSRATEAK
jgi:hypothetical protein